MVFGADILIHAEVPPYISSSTVSMQAAMWEGDTRRCEGELQRTEIHQ